MKRYFTILISLCLISLTSFAGNDKYTLGGRSAAMGNASVAFTDVYAVFSNQAGLARLQGTSVGLYAENRFLLSELNMFGAAVGLPTKSGTFGLGAIYFGNEGYSEAKLNLAYGRNLSSKLAIGAEFDLLSVSIADYGSRSAMTFGVGLLYDFTPQLSAGVHVFNPLRIDLTDSEFDRVPTIMKFGITFTPSEKVMLAIETEKNMDQQAIIKLGIEYKFVEQFYVRAGGSTNPGTATFGVGVNLNALKIDLSGSYHNVLGYSPHLSISYAPRKKKEETPVSN